MIVNKICEGNDCLNVAFSGCMTSLQGMVPSARSVGHGSSDIAVSRNLAKQSNIQSENTKIREFVIHTTELNLY